MSNDLSRHIYGPGFDCELERRPPPLLLQDIFLTGRCGAQKHRTFFAHVDKPRLETLFKAAAVRRVIQQGLESGGIYREATSNIPTAVCTMSSADNWSERSTSSGVRPDFGICRTYICLRV
jgi:hypothetical protein